MLLTVDCTAASYGEAQCCYDAINADEVTSKSPCRARLLRLLLESDRSLGLLPIRLREVATGPRVARIG